MILAHHPVLTPTYTKPEHCPKYQSCNAPICPLDAKRHKRANTSDDATCFYLLESVKHGAKAHFQVALLGELYGVIVRARADIATSHKRIAAKLESAKKTGSRMARKFRGEE